MVAALRVLEQREGLAARHEVHRVKASTGTLRPKRSLSVCDAACIGKDDAPRHRSPAVGICRVECGRNPVENAGWVGQESGVLDGYRPVCRCMPPDCFNE